MDKYQDDVEPVEAPERRLTARQERFIVEYLECQNGAEAARRAGYSEHTARQMANENLSKPYIAEAIQRKRDEIMSGTEDKVAWLVERLTAEATDDENGEATRVSALEVLGQGLRCICSRKAGDCAVRRDVSCRLGLR